MATSQAQLPQDADNQTYVTVHALLAGGLWLPYKEVFQDSIDEPPEVGSEIPFIAFLITHPTFGRLLFDLGMRKVRPCLVLRYSPWFNDSSSMRKVGLLR